MRHRNVPFVLAAALLAAALLLAPPLLAERPQQPQRYQVHVQQDVMVTARDGTRLATDVYLPANADGTPAEGRFPTIMLRTPYGKQRGSGMLRYFVQRGYAGIAQDTRGRFGSEGSWWWMYPNGEDGFDTCAWIGQQPWSDGQVAMYGTSYDGGTQHAIALERAPELKTIIPVDAVCNLGYQSMRNAGAYELRFFNWIFTHSATGSRAMRNPEVRPLLQRMSQTQQRRQYVANLLEGPFRPGTTPLQHATEYEEWLVAAMENGANNEFWEQNNILDFPERYKDMPLYLVGGWYDSWAGNTTANYRVLSGRKEGPIYLIMGPWIHGAQGSSAHGQVNFGSAAAIPDTRAWRLEWFDHWLKGRENSVGREAPFAAPVRIFVMGTGDGSADQRGRLNHGGFWRDEPEWPLSRARLTNYYLQPGGGLAPTPPAAEEAATGYEFDPRNPVPNIGGNISSGGGILVQGAYDQRGGSHIWNFQEPTRLADRPDVLVFQTEPLTEDLEVTGEIEAKLWISSTAPDTDFTAKLVDVYPPSQHFPQGFELQICEGIVRARFRESLKEEKLMTPGEVYEVTVKLYPTANVFKRGHRIRVDISSSNFPRFDVNPNTGEPLNRHTRVETARNTIHHDRTRPSHIVLPIVPSAGR